MPRSEVERISEIMEIVKEIASSVKDASNRAEPDVRGKLKAAAETFVDHATNAASDIDELFSYLQSAKNSSLGRLVDDTASRLGAKTLEHRWDEIEAIYRST